MIPGLKPMYELNLCVCGEPLTGAAWFIFCQGCGSIKYRAAKEAVYRHYGQECVCCGATENLAMDHIDGSGKEHRQNDALANSNLCAWLVANNYPPGFQPLCRSCNGSKSRGDHCKKHMTYLGPDVNRHGKSVHAPIINVTVNVYADWSALL